MIAVARIILDDNDGLDASRFLTILVGPEAGIAQLVEHNLAKVGVASSSLVSRSSFQSKSLYPQALLLSEFGWVAEWLCSGLQSRGRRFDSDPSLQTKRLLT